MTPFEPSASYILWKLRGGEGYYPCPPEELEAYPEDRRQETWNNLTGEAYTWHLMNGTPSENSEDLSRVIRDLNERSRQVELVDQYRFEPEKIKYNELSPFTRLVIKIIQMLKQEQRVNSNLSKVPKEKIAEKQAEYHNLLESHNDKVKYLDCMRLCCGG